MAALFGSGHILDIVLVVIAMEFIALLTSQGGRAGLRRAPDIGANLLAAAALMVGAKLLLRDAHWIYIGSSLCVALAAHVTAMRRRWQTV